MMATHNQHHSSSSGAPAVQMLRALIMCRVCLGGIIGTGLVGPNRSSIEAEFGLSHTQFGAGLAIAQVAISVLVLLIAPLLGRMPHTRVIAAGLAVQTAGFAAIVFSQSTAMLVIGWAGVMGGTYIGVILNPLSMSLWPDNPRRGVVLLHSYNALGKVIGPAIAAVCLIFAWRISMLFTAFITLMLLISFAAISKNLTAPATKADVSYRDGIAALKMPSFWLCTLPFGLIAGGEVAFATLVPVYFETEYGVAPEMASVFLIIHLIGLVAGRFISSYVSQNVSNSAIIGLCLLSGIAVFPLLFIRNIPAGVISLFILGFMFSTTWPTFYAQVSGIFSGRPEMLAYGASLGNALGLSLCVLFSSMIADRNLGYALMFGPAILWLFGAVFYVSPLSQKVPIEKNT